MITIIIICLAATAVFNLMALYFMWKNSKSIKELESLRKESDASWPD